MRREDLTARQLEVIRARDRVILVTGGPGSGKTTAALWSAREAIATGEVGSGQNVLFLTFSRSAVSQIGRRAPGVLATMRDRIEILTFHGLAYRLVSGFGRYAGLGRSVPRIQSEAARKLFGDVEGAFTYDDLVPQALRLLAHPKVGSLLRRRWPLVICDEFQDTGTDQWSLVLQVAEQARLILLADPDQMIHTYRRDVTPARLAVARRMSTREIILEERSHRDPTGIVPAVARAVLNRDFENEAIQYAAAEGKLVVRIGVDARVLPSSVMEEVRRLRASGCRTVGVFGFTNHGSTELSAELTAAGVANTIVGVAESHSEGIGAMAALAGHAAGVRTKEEVKVALATFATACGRGSRVPEVASALIGRAPMPPGLEDSIAALCASLVEAAEGPLADVLEVIGPSWGRLFTSGRRHWRRAFGNLAALSDDLLTRPATAENVLTLIARCAAGRTAGLVSDPDESNTNVIQLMNFHQTKGREVDGVVLVFRPDDFYARRGEGEPFIERSRLLYVAISRARHVVRLILPPQPHPLVSPFAAYKA